MLGRIIEIYGQITCSSPKSSAIKYLRKVYLETEYTKLDKKISLSTYQRFLKNLSHIQIGHLLQSQEV